MITERLRLEREPEIVELIISDLGGPLRLFHLFFPSLPTDVVIRGRGSRRMPTQRGDLFLVSQAI